MKIGIIITTFLRQELLFNCLLALDKYWNNDYFVIVVDQDTPSNKKDKFWKNLKNIKGEFIKTDYDIGALKARNIAIKRIYELNIPYILMSADSIFMTKIYNFNPIINFLEQEKDRFLCGIDIKDRLPWECDIIKKEKFYLDVPRRSLILFENYDFQPVDICRNVFICKTEMLRNALYDEDRLMADHESSFWRWKEKGYKCFYTSNIQTSYISHRPPEYIKARNRFQTSKEIMMKKYNLTGWVEYSSDLLTYWNKWRMKNVKK